MSGGLPASSFTGSCASNSREPSYLIFAPVHCSNGLYESVCCLASGSTIDVYTDTVLPLRSPYCLYAAQSVEPVDSSSVPPPLEQAARTRARPTPPTTAAFLRRVRMLNITLTS